MILCVDFDGVLHAYTSGWQGPDVIPDGPVPGAIPWLKSLIESKKFHVCVYSSRSKYEQGILAMRKALTEWFEQAGEENSLRFINAIEFSSEKPAAYLTIDDRAICFTGQFPSIETMEEFRPWYKKKKIG